MALPCRIASRLQVQKSHKKKEVKPTITAQQYVSELDRFWSTERTSNKKVVLGVSVSKSMPCEAISKSPGKIYCKAFGFGGDGHLVLKESELIDCDALVIHEELAGLNVLKNAISNG